MVTVTGRNGKRDGLGTGFVVGDGLIATNLHVIGEARPISVVLGGKEWPVRMVHASDRSLDLEELEYNEPFTGTSPVKSLDTLTEAASLHVSHHRWYHY